MNKITNLFEKISLRDGASPEFPRDIVNRPENLGDAYIWFGRKPQKFLDGDYVHVLLSPIGTGANTEEQVLAEMNNKIEDVCLKTLLFAASRNRTDVINENTTLIIDERLENLPFDCKQIKYPFLESNTYEYLKNDCKVSHDGKLVIVINSITNTLVRLYAQEDNPIWKDDKVDGYYTFFNIGVGVLDNSKLGLMFV